MSRAYSPEEMREAAENAAKRLADANGIALSEIEIEDTECKAVFDEHAIATGRCGVEAGHITHILRKHFGVVMMQSYRRGSRTMMLSFFGCRLNIDIAKYVWEILKRESAKACREASKEAGYDGEVKWRKGYWGLESYVAKRKCNIDRKSFMLGWFHAIDTTLTNHPIRNDADQLEAEARAAERKFEEYKSSGANVREEDQPTTKKHDYEGIAMGSKINLNRPCGANASPLALGM